MADNPENFKPQNVTETAAEGYLLATGWVKAPEETGTRNWISPKNRAAFSRGQAILRQFQEDFSRLLFVMQHAPPELLAMLVPPHVIEQLTEFVKAQSPTPPPTEPN